MSIKPPSSKMQKIARIATGLPIGDKKYYQNLVKQGNLSRKRGQAALEDAASAIGTAAEGIKQLKSKNWNGLGSKARKLLQDLNSGVNNFNASINHAIKGLFNDVDWYRYLGVLPSLPGNELRPYTPASVAKWHTDATNAGIAHMIQTEVEFSLNFRNSEAFQLVMTKYFRKIREELRSNLPYSQKDVEDVIVATIAMYAKVVLFNRYLAWYTHVEPEIPEFHTGMYTVPTSLGVSFPQEVVAYNDESYSKTVNTLAKIASIISQLMLPKKWVEYIDWWMGTVFKDEDRWNEQYYINIFQELPLFGIVNGRLEEIGVFNAFFSDPELIYKEALDILQVGGVILADLNKKNLMPVLDMPEARVLVDHEYFNVLINTYTKPVLESQAWQRYTSTDEYVRMDFLPEIFGENRITSLHALSEWANYDSPMRIKAQAVLLAVDPSQQIKQSLSDELNNPGTMDLTNYQPINGEFIWIKTDGYFHDLTEVNVYGNQYVGSGMRVLSPTVPCTNNIDMVPSITTMDWTTPRGGFTTTWDIRGPRTLWFTMQVQTSSGIVSRNVYYEGLLNDGTTNYPTAKPAEYNGKIQITGQDVKGQSLNFKAYNAKIWRVADAAGRAQIMCEVPQQTSSVQSTDSFAFIFFAGEYQEGKVFLNIAGFNILQEGRYTYSPTIGNVEFFSNGVNWCNYLASAFDYHIPFLYDQELVIQGSVNDQAFNVKYDQGFTLLKEWYTPLTVNRDSVETALYWMYLGLFNLEFN